MSKFVKNLIAGHLRNRLQDVNDALLVNVVGMDANTNHRLRNELAAKNIHLLVVNNSLANLAVSGTPLARLFEGVAGSAAICWGGEDIVGLAKEIVKLVRSDKYKPLEARGGVMDGEQITAPQVTAGQQVAQPHRAVEPFDGADPQPRAQPGEPVDGRRWRPGQPDRAAGEGRGSGSRPRGDTPTVTRIFH